MARVLVTYTGSNRHGYALSVALAASRAGDEVTLYLAGDAVNLAWERSLKFPNEFGQPIADAWNAVRAGGVAILVAADRVAYNRSEQQVAAVGAVPITVDQYVGLVRQTDVVIPV